MKKIILICAYANIFCFPNAYAWQISPKTLSIAKQFSIAFAIHAAGIAIQTYTINAAGMQDSPLRYPITLGRLSGCCNLTIKAQNALRKQQDGDGIMPHSAGMLTATVCFWLKPLVAEYMANRRKKNSKKTDSTIKSKSGSSYKDPAGLPHYLDNKNSSIKIEDITEKS